MHIHAFNKDMGSVVYGQKWLTFFVWLLISDQLSVDNSFTN